MTDLVNLETETRTIVLAQTITDGDTTHAPSADAIYDALGGKAASSHTHSVADITNFPNFLNIVTDKGTASADTMDKLYIEVGQSKTDVYYTVRSGTSPNYTYSWSKMDTDILDDLSIDWSDIQNKPTIPTASSSTPSADVDGGAVGSSSDYAKADHQHPLSSAYATSGHTHSDKLDVAQTSHKGKNVVVDSSSGDITFEDKPTIPTAGSSTPSADVSGGAVGSSSNFAKADHQHPLSSAYAASSHGHTYSDVTGVSTLEVTITYTDTTTETKNLLIYTAPSS